MANLHRISHDCVRVAVRIRPLTTSERDNGVVKIVPANHQIVVGNNAFTYNYVFDTNASQEQVYNGCVHEMMEKLFNGYNVTILAYGQSGSGKTYTMGTSYDGEHETTGITLRAIEYIFNRIEQDNENRRIVKCSFMELYQERVFDLLRSGQREDLRIREDRDGGIVLPGLTELEVPNSSAAIDCLARGSANRSVARTEMNASSSRSHAIFTLTVQAGNGSKPSKFLLVDLAGSERLKKTQATGERFNEAVQINQALLALGNVISTLSSKTNLPVPYRSAKLTRILKDSLGGNSVTLMIACISPADENTNETLSTLRYADRARKIKNKPIVNPGNSGTREEHTQSLVAQLAERIQELELGKAAGEAQFRNENALLQRELEKSEAENKRLKDKIEEMNPEQPSTSAGIAENTPSVSIAFVDLTEDHDSDAGTSNRNPQNTPRFSIAAFVDLTEDHDSDAGTSNRNPQNTQRLSSNQWESIFGLTDPDDSTSSSDELDVRRTPPIVHRRSRLSRIPRVHVSGRRSRPAVFCRCLGHCLTKRCPCRANNRNCTINCRCQFKCHNQGIVDRRNLRMSLLACKCRGNCSTKKCSCRAAGRSCTRFCNCSRTCANRGNSDEHSSDGSTT